MLKLNKEDLISVIIPIYNVEKYLSECISSVLEQTYKNLEIILIDDGSTDNSLDVCKSFAEKDKRIRVIHQQNQGIAQVRNLGVAQAKGELLFWVDSDDYICNEMIERLYDNLIKYDADMSICDYTQGEKRDYNFISTKTPEIMTFDSKKGLELIYKSNHYSFIMAASWAKLIKKSLYNGLQYPKNKVFEDIYMSHHLINNCKKIVFTDEVMYYYYQWPESILGKKLYIEKLDYLGAFEERIHFFDKLGFKELSEKARIQYLHSLIWEYSRAKDILKNKPMVKHIKKEYRKYYSFGTQNEDVKNETKMYMLRFYLSPYLTDFFAKVRCKLFRS